MNEKIILFIILLAISVAILVSTISTTVFAAYNNTDIDVNVSSLSQITLYPNYINWTLVSVGTAGETRNITIKNTGSVNVSGIFAYVNTLANETTRPYGSSNPASYDAGGVLTISNETDPESFYLGRLEWNWTEDIPNHDWSAVARPISWGYFRKLDMDYVWVVGSGTDGNCNTTGVTGTHFAIMDAVDTGYAETRTPTTTNITVDGNDSNWTYFSVVRPLTPLNDSCVAVSSNCSKIYIYNFDRRTSPNFVTCSKSDYIYSGNLTPGDSVIVKVTPWIPRGIPAGNMTRTTLTIETTT